MKKIIGFTVVILLGLSLLAGCSQKPVETEDPANESVTSADPEQDQTDSSNEEEGYLVKTVEEGVILVASDWDYPPFITSSAVGGPPFGFEKDMMDAIGREMGYEIKYPEQFQHNFDSILTAVAEGTTVDVGVSSITVIPGREELVGFSIPYFNVMGNDGVSTGEHYAIAVSMNNPELLQLINDGLKKIKASGEFDEIFSRYFPDLKPPALSS